MPQTKSRHTISSLVREASPEELTAGLESGTIKFLTNLSTAATRAKEFPRALPGATAKDISRVVILDVRDRYGEGNVMTGEAHFDPEKVEEGDVPRDHQMIGLYVTTAAFEADQSSRHAAGPNPN